MDDKYRLDSGEVVTRDELRARLIAELDAMDAETRAANCDGTVDDLITDSALVGIYERVHDQDDEQMPSSEHDRQLRAELAIELGFYPASLVREDVERYRQTNAAQDAAPTHEMVTRKFAHVQVARRLEELERARRTEVADLYE